MTDGPVADGPALGGAGTVRQERPPGAWSVSALLGGSALVLLGSAFFLNRDPSALGLLWGCPWRTLTTLPCPTCGITRVFLLIAAGDLGAAIALAPLPFVGVALALVAGAWWLLARALGLADPDLVLGRLLRKRAVWLPTVVSVLVLWGYAIARSLATGAP